MPVPIDLDVPHLEDAAVVIDARADEPAWEGALVVDQFVVYYPVPDAEPTGQATVRVMSDPEALYILWEVVDPEPDKVRARLANRDNIWGDDWVGVYLDPAGQGQRAYLIMCNPLGVQTDATRLAGGDDRVSWEGQWRSAGRLTETGYVVEMAIPWRAVRHPEDMQTFGLSFLRMVSREAQRSGWPRRDPEVSGILVQEYLVGGPGELPVSRGLSLVPELTFGRTDEGPPARWGTVQGATLGATLRFDPRPGVTTLATVNPDFSQVETDALQIDVNNRFPLYFAERRPFFLEGQEWFEAYDTSLVYTRSMVSPRYGARVIVEEGAWQLAMMHALDGSPRGSVNNNRGWTDAEVEGLLAFDTVLRARRDLARDGYVGLVMSDKTLAGSQMANRLGAVDARVRLGDRMVAAGSFAGSSTTLADGDVLMGPSAQGGFQYSSRRLDGELGGAWISPDFRAENGFLTRTDVVGLYGSSRLKAYPRGPLASQVGWRPGTVDLLLDTDGRPLELGLNTGADAQLSRNSTLSASLAVRQEYVSDTWLEYRQGNVQLSGEPSRFFDGGVSLTLGEGPAYGSLLVGDQVKLGGWTTLKLGRHVRVGGSGVWEQLTASEAQLYQGYVARGSLDVFATRAHYARVLYDHSSFTGYDRAQVLLAWQRGPNQAAWLGGVVSEGDEGLSWQVFAKLRWVFMR
ncbi:MAG: carbohydrate binding family 9 domain-containing protein [Alphaproteobacteria bacterium]|nr:carbohydrate binding family 9 domain-containing protein [Alphaproteobacteria bacterium]